MLTAVSSYRQPAQGHTTSSGVRPLALPSGHLLFGGAHCLLPSSNSFSCLAHFFPRMGARVIFLKSTLQWLPIINRTKSRLLTMAPGGSPSLSRILIIACTRYLLTQTENDFPSPLLPGPPNHEVLLSLPSSYPLYVSHFSLSSVVVLYPCNFSSGGELLLTHSSQPLG